MIATLGSAAGWTTLLADNGPRNGPDFGKSSPIGLVVVVILLAATITLVWSMNRQLRKLPATFDPERPEPDQAADEGTVPGPGDPPGPADPTRPPGRPDGGR